MATLLLRLSGPMQSWGTQSKFDVRDTGYEPSKSGVVGLICAALGRRRDEPVDDLAALKMGVRVDRQGTIKRDFHTAGRDGFYRISGKVERKDLIVTQRYYLADATFLVGLEGERDSSLLHTVHEALRDPVWMLYLGRKANVPGEPVWLEDGFLDTDLDSALRDYPWLVRQVHGKEHVPDKLTTVVDDPNGDVVRYDYPLSFARREFHVRRVRIGRVDNPALMEEN